MDPVDLYYEYHYGYEYLSATLVGDPSEFNTAEKIVEEANQGLANSIADFNTQFPEGIQQGLSETLKTLVNHANYLRVRMDFRLNRLMEIKMKKSRGSYDGYFDGRSSQARRSFTKNELGNIIGAAYNISTFKDELKATIETDQLTEILSKASERFESIKSDYAQRHPTRTRATTEEILEPYVDSLKDYQACLENLGYSLDHYLNRLMEIKNHEEENKYRGGFNHLSPAALCFTDGERTSIARMRGSIFAYSIGMKDTVKSANKTLAEMRKAGQQALSQGKQGSSSQGHEHIPRPHR
jgi:hypothetical protein